MEEMRGFKPLIWRLPSGASDLAKASEKLLGGIDILVNNAGVFSFGPTAETTAEAFDTMFASNVRGPYFLAARLAPAMAAADGDESLTSLPWPHILAWLEEPSTGPAKRPCSC